MLLSFFRKKLDPGVSVNQGVLKNSSVKDTTEIKDTIYGNYS